MTDLKSVVGVISITTNTNALTYIPTYTIYLSSQTIVSDPEPPSSLSEPLAHGPSRKEMPYVHIGYIDDWKCPLRTAGSTARKEKVMNKTGWRIIAAAMLMLMLSLVSVGTSVQSSSARSQTAPVAAQGASASASMHSLGYYTWCSGDHERAGHWAYNPTYGPLYLGYREGINHGSAHQHLYYVRTWGRYAWFSCPN
jgi:hypothetical protein